MGFKVLEVCGKALTQVAKKAYVKPMCEVESIGLNMEQLTRTSVEINPAKKIKLLQARLDDVLRSPYCEMPNYMKLIPEGASQEETIAYLQKMFQESKFFSREVTNITRYGKNFDWAKKMNYIHINASEAIKNEKSFEEVLFPIAKKYSKAEWKTLEGAYGETRLESGIYRGNDKRKPSIMGWGPLTGYAGRGAGKNGGYPDYVKRLDNAEKGITPPYNNFTLTKMSDWTMFHPTNAEVEQNMKIISEKYNKILPIIKKQKTERLNPTDYQEADNIISEIYYLMAHTCPFKRGSNGISDILMRSLYSALGINKPHIKPGIGLDLEAFCMDLKEYKMKWNSFFE